MASNLSVKTRKGPEFERQSIRPTSTHGNFHAAAFACGGSSDIPADDEMLENARSTVIQLCSRISAKIGGRPTSRHPLRQISFGAVPHTEANTGAPLAHSRARPPGVAKKLRPAGGLPERALHALTQGADVCASVCLLSKHTDSRRRKHQAPDRNPPRCH